MEHASRACYMYAIICISSIFLLFSRVSSCAYNWMKRNSWGEEADLGYVRNEITVIISWVFTTVLYISLNFEIFYLTVFYNTIGLYENLIITTILHSYTNLRHIIMIMNLCSLYHILTQNNKNMFGTKVNCKIYRAYNYSDSSLSVIRGIRNARHIRAITITS